MKEEFTIQIVGPGVKPEAVSLRRLFAILRNLECAVHAMADESETPQPISLVGVSEGSENLTVAVGESSVPSYRNLTDCIRARSFDRLPSQCLNALRNLTAEIAQEEWKLVFKGRPDLGVRRATLSKRVSVPLPEPSVITGSTTVYGTLLVAGGARPHLLIRLHSGGTLKVSVEASVVRELCARVYEDVGISGVATWDPDKDYRIEHFEFTAVLPYRQTGIADAFDSLRDIAHGNWDGRSVEEYMQEIRGG